jgi:hypothetical protein
MIFQTIVLLLIILATLYWMWQGTLSCTLMLVSAVFASIAAAGWHESLEPLVARFRPDYARPICFFLLFLTCFLVVRHVGGMLAPKNVRLPKWIDLGVALPAAFVTAMMSIGTLVLAVEMVPTRQVILGYDRFPNGLASQPTPLWIPADGFVQWVWRQTSGGSLGGNESFVAAHPDLERELYGNRHVVVFGSAPVVPPELLKVPAAYVIADPAEIQARSIPANSDEKVVIVRSQVAMGDISAARSCDGDSNYRITPAQVRLITVDDQPRQFNPIGYMVRGKTFKRMALDTDHFVDDYNPAPDAKLIHDWVFAIPADAQPRYFDEKALARKDIAVVLATETEPAVVVAGKDYPPEAWEPAVPTIQVAVTHSYGEATDQPVVGQTFYLFEPVIVKRRIRAYIDQCWDLLEKSTGTDRQSNLNRFLPMKVGWDDNHLVPVNQFLELWFISHETRKAEDDVRSAENMLKNELVPILQREHLQVFTATTNFDGKIPPTPLSPGGYVGVIWVTEKAKNDFHFWAVAMDVPKASGPPNKIVYRFDDSNAYIRKP